MNECYWIDELFWMIFIYFCVYLIREYEEFFVFIGVGYFYVCPVRMAD